eukprot:IDg13376t1
MCTVPAWSARRHRRRALPGWSLHCGDDRSDALSVQCTSKDSRSSLLTGICSASRTRRV